MDPNFIVGYVMIAFLLGLLVMILVEWRPRMDLIMEMRLMEHDIKDMQEQIDEMLKEIKRGSD